MTNDQSIDLAIEHQRHGRPAEAEPLLRQVLAVEPDNLTALQLLGVCALRQGRHAEAVELLQRAVARVSRSAELLNNLGLALHGSGLDHEAAEAYRRALAINDRLPLVWNNLANALRELGRYEEAFEPARRAIELDATPTAAGGFVQSLLYHPDYSAEALYEAHRQWARRFADPLTAAAPPHGNDRSPDRRLRVGYISPDFRQHVVGRNFLPLIAHHDRRDFEIYAYSQSDTHDELTARIRAGFDHWREIVPMGDEQVADLIRADRIDILVDLAQHTGGNRLLVMARKPAPVQVAHMGYPATPGLKAMDYRFTDVHLEPPELGDALSSERPVRLASFWCFDPIEEAPPAGDLPALSAGRVTFGSLNATHKVTQPTIELWAKVLHAVPASRLLLLTGRPNDQNRDQLERFERLGVSASRIVFRSKRPRDLYLKIYGEIDIGLDTFPYNGHTTSCDAFWMGVPVITMAGRTSVGRAGVSLLRNLGLEDLVARTPEQFVRIAADLADDLPRLANLRRGMRDRMRTSPLMQYEAYARSIESAYRQMWRAWCEGRPAEFVNFTRSD